MREWQMTDDQFRAQSYKNMQIQKRKENKRKEQEQRMFRWSKMNARLSLAIFFQTNRGTRHDNKLNIQRPTAQR